MLRLRAATLAIGLARCAATTDLLRPEFHFMPESNWMNDPNGPFYDAETGLYHLMYQYLTPRVWGHAVSRNLADWTLLSTALNYTDEWYTQVPGETAGVYSGSATIMRGAADGRSQVWLSASTPTNDMMLLAFPSDLTDPYLEEWTWDSRNPVIYSTVDNSVPPGRDPTEFWPCGAEADSRWCVAYATQQSEGCPCSGVSGIAIFSSTFDESVPMSSSSWTDWSFEGYMLNDSANAVMWECVDFFPMSVQTDPFTESVWLMKFSIGPGPSYDRPWGNLGPRDYYVTGIYNPRNINVFHVEDYQWEMAMSRDSTMALDVGSFYASKSFLSDELGRVMWGWLPEERPTDPHGSPFGWAGVMSLPRQVVPYSDNNGSWYISTPPVEAVLECIRTSSVTMSNIDVGPNGVADTTIVGTQIELLLNIDSSGLRNGDECGVRVLSSAQNDQSSLEYTDIGVIFTVDLLDELQEIALYVDPSASCANNSAAVNRTVVISAPIHRDLLSSLPSLNIRVIVDHSVIESFLADGRRVITRRVYPAYPSTSTGIQLYSICGNDTDCGSCRFTTVQAWSLRTTNSISDDEKTDSSGDIDQLETWYIALICVLFVVVIAALTAVYFVFIKAPKEKIEMEQALIVQKNKI